MSHRPRASPAPGPRRPRRDPARACVDRRPPTGAGDIGRRRHPRPARRAGAAARARWCSASASATRRRSRALLPVARPAGGRGLWSSARRSSPPTRSPRPPQRRPASRCSALTRGASVGAAGRAAARRCSPRATSATPGRRRSAGCRRATCSRWPTRSPRCSTRRSPSRTAARGCSRSPDGRTRPTRPESRRSSAGRCPSATPGCSPSAACSATCTAATSRSIIEPPGDPAVDDFSMPRVAVAVRAGDEVLGSIWAAVREPLSHGPDRRRCATPPSLVALHMLRIRAGADVERRLRADLLSTALEGGRRRPGGAATARALADQPVVVLGARLCWNRRAALRRRRRGPGRRTATPRPTPGHAPERGAPAVRGRAGRRRRVRADPGLPRRSSDGEARAVRIATDFLDRVGDRVPAGRRHRPPSPRTRPGWPTRGPGPTGRCGSCAAVHRRAPARGPARPTCTSRRWCWSCATWSPPAATGRPGPPRGWPPTTQQHNTNLLETLRAWLDAFGDVIAASAAMYVHPNTFRYRLRRAGRGRRHRPGRPRRTLRRDAPAAGLRPTGP